LFTQVVTADRDPIEQARPRPFRLPIGTPEPLELQRDQPRRACKHCAAAQQARRRAQLALERRARDRRSQL
jgi:hypothetical protein